MTAQLERLLRDCTVLLTDEHDRAAGSGFFVAPGMVLTAAHVVGKAGAGIRARWNGTAADVSAIEWQEPSDSESGGVWQLPDLALLRLDDAAVGGHPCVLLSGLRPGSELLAEGYTRGTSGGHAPDSVRLELESLRPEGEFTVFKCKNAIIDDGLSGGPVLDVSSGLVVGVTKGQRTGRFPVGGIAVGVGALRERHRDLWAANERFHHTDHRWEFARLNTSDTFDPTQATSEFLELVKQVIVKRPAILPPGGSKPDIHQMPSVRVLPRGAQAADGARHDGSFDDLDQHDVRFDGVFQWSPLRVRWQAVVLCGMPGHGKSWLLNTHADTITRDALSRITTGETGWMSVRVPIVVDCAALGKMLSTNVTRDGVLDALVRTIQQETDLPAVPVDAVVRLAHADGRLVSCLDALDEVGMADREKVRQALPILVERGNQLLVTSRPYSLLRTHTSGLGGSLTAEVIGFSSGQVFAFARGWFSGDAPRARELEAELLDRPELRDLARVPLLAAFLCSLASEGDQVRVLPTTRAQIYRSVVLGALSGRWRAPNQQAVDPDIPPEPALRLSVLADAVGRLSEPWRSRVDRFGRTELAAALREHPDYARVKDEAEARWFAWQVLRSAPSGQIRPPGDPLLWEYMFDGLLAHDLTEGEEPTVRFAHPVLAEYCVASYVAAKSEPDMQKIVDAHRWFDASWQEVWSLTASLMPEPDALVEILLDSPVDAWFEQTFLASRCVTAGGRQVRPELRTRVVSSVLAAARSWRSFDRERALPQLGELIRTRLDEGVKAAHSLLAGDIASATRLRVAAMLAEIGDQAGLAIVRTAIVDQSIPATERAWCVRAAVVAEDAESLIALQIAIKSARTVGELRLLVNAVPVEGQVGGDLTGQILRDQDVHPLIRTAVGGALIKTGGEHRIRLAKELAGTPLTAWSVRAALIAELLAIGEDDVLPLGLELFDDPNLSAEQRVTLVEALVRRGQVSVLPRAVQMLTRRAVHWEQRRRLARAIADLGRAGIDELLRQVRSPLALDLKMRHLIALVEVGECLDLAAQLVADPGAPSWIRTRVATSLLERGYLSIPGEVLRELATDPDHEHYFQGELIIAMITQGVPDAGDAAQGLLTRARAVGDYYTGSKEFINGLTTAGAEGQAVLIRIAQDSELAEEDRALAIIALADVTPAEAARLALSLTGQFSAFTDARLTILLADKGGIELTARLSALLEREPAVYRTLFQLLSSSRAPRELIERLLPVGLKATRGLAPKTRTPVRIDANYLESADLVWSSAAEQAAITQWVEDQLQKRVGARLITFLTESQLEEFERLENAEQQLEFLATRAAGYPELVRSQLSLLQNEIRRDPSIVPRFSMVAGLPPLKRLSYVAATLSEWVDTSQSDGPQAGTRFFAQNASVIVTKEARSLLRFACQLTPALNPYEGHQFLVEMALGEGLDTALERMTDTDQMHDLLRGFLNDANKAMLNAALGALVLEPDSEVVFFYGSLGAALVGHKKLSIELMRESGRRAQPDQRMQGLGTLNKQAARFEWPEELVQELRSALNGQEGTT